MEEPSLELKIRIMDGQELNVNCHIEDTVLSLKQQIESKCSVPVSQQKLIFRGRVLSDNATLRMCNISNHCVLVLVKHSVSTLVFELLIGRS